MPKKLFVTFMILLLLLTGTIAVRADAPDFGYAWQNHAEPYNFKFNNLIDNHQHTRLLKNGRLQGYIYIQFTGETINGIPVARRADCDDPTLDCRVGWEVTGIPVEGARLVQKGPRLWSFADGALPSDPEFVHFHWTGVPKKPCGLVLNDVSYSGYLFKRTAVTTFYWLGGNDDKETGRLVKPGIDLHSNLEGRWIDGGGHGGEDPGSEDPGGDTGCGGHDTGDTGCGGTGDTGCGGH